MPGDAGVVTDAGYPLPEPDRTCAPPARCNPPAPNAPPVSFIRRVVSRQDKDGGIVFVVGTGGESIDMKWRGVFVGDDERPIASTEFTIREVTSVQVVCFLAGHSKLPSERVRITAPRGE